jgi:hypothetical protein
MVNRRAIGGDPGSQSGRAPTLWNGIVMATFLGPDDPDAETTSRAPTAATRTTTTPTASAMGQMLRRDGAA